MNDFFFNSLYPRHFERRGVWILMSLPLLWCTQWGATPARWERGRLRASAHTSGERACLLTWGPWWWGSGSSVGLQWQHLPCHCLGPMVPSQPTFLSPLWTLQERIKIRFLNFTVLNFPSKENYEQIMNSMLCMCLYLDKSLLMSASL